MEQLETMNNNLLIRQKHGDIKIEILDRNSPEAALQVPFLLRSSHPQGADGGGGVHGSIISITDHTLLGLQL